MRPMSVVELAEHGRVISSLVDVTEALRVMGLTVADVHLAIDAGEVDRDSCTANNPPTDAGGRSHGTTVRMLREVLIPREWAACDVRNFSTVVSPSLEMEIAVASGDDATGDPDREPRTKNKKGELVLLGIERNRGQGWLFKPAPVDRTKVREAATTWILLRYRPEGKDFVRSELSLPISMGDDDRVEKWGTRIVLPDLALGGGGRGFKRRDDADEDIDVAVVRKSA